MTKTKDGDMAEWGEWEQVAGEGLDNFVEILYEKRQHLLSGGSVARVSLNKPERMNTLTLATVDEMFRAFYDANHDPMVGVIIVAGKGKHFGAGGDVEWERWGLREAFYNRYPHNRLIRLSRKPVIAQVQGYCIAGHNHMAYCCDFTIAADNAVFGQAGPRVSSPADGFFVPYLTKVVGAKKAREMWMLCRKYKAEQALEMGLVNTVVPVAELERETVHWCREILQHSPMALRCLKSALNADCDGQAGLQELSGNASMLFYLTEEGQEGRNAFNEKRKPDFSKFKRNP